MARDAAYILVALALCCILSIVVHQLYIQKQAQYTQPIYSMLELKEFRDLPSEFKTMIRRTMPDPTTIRKQWAHMTTHHKKAVLDKVSNGGMIPFPEEMQHVEHKKPVPPSLKKGFLLKQDKKKNPKNKENDEVVALGRVKTVTVTEEWAEEADGLAPGHGDTPFLGSDE